MNSRLNARWLFVSMSSVVLISSCAHSVSNMGTDRRPNVILIIADDMNDYVGFLGGHSQTKTPSLDALAERGAVFLNAQVNSPVCGPSRAALLSGLAPHTTGYYGYEFVENHWRDNIKLNRATVFPEYLRAGGYSIMTTGKVWHNHQEDVSLYYETGHPPSWGPWAWDGSDINQYEHGQVSQWRNSVPHPDMPEGYSHDSSYGSLDNVPVVPRNDKAGTPGHSGWRLFFQHYHYASATDRDKMPDELNADWAVEKLKEQHDRPFLMMVGFNRPHTPLYVPQEFLDQHPLDKVELADHNHSDLDDIAPELSANHPLASNIGYGKWKYDLIIENGGIGELKKWTQAYLASISYVDHQVGKILEALEDSRYADNTYIIFTSDHGYHLGEKGMLHKNTPWEESTRVPLVIAGPGIKTGPVTQPVTLVDLYPTFIELAKRPGAPNKRTNQLELDGHSLLPLISDGHSSEWLGHPAALTSVASTIPVVPGHPADSADQFHSLRTVRFRYIRTPGGQEELYDHQNDPNEWTNVADKTEYARELNKLRGMLESILLSESAISSDFQD